MKKILGLSALILSGLALATSPIIAQPVPVQYQNIVNISVGYGTTNTLFNPVATLRPYRGDLLRVSIPASCGPTTISQLALIGRTLDAGIPVPLPSTLVEMRPEFGVNRYVFQINGGQPATVREIGMLVTTYNTFGCQIAFEQGNSNAFGGQDECNLNYACPANVDSTASCEANPNFSGIPRFIEYSTGGSNKCTLNAGLKRQICGSGYKPSQFLISCR